MTSISAALVEGQDTLDLSWRSELSGAYLAIAKLLGPAGKGLLD